MASIFKLFESTPAARKAALELLKRGKSEDQSKCIEYLYTPDLPAKGCMGKIKKGCFGTGVMSIEEYIAHIQKCITNLHLKARAIEKIGLDEAQISEIPPVLLTSFIYKGNGVVCKTEEVENGFWKTVSNKYSVTWIFFSDSQMYTYTYIFDSISDDAVELTRDIFYKDVTCIRTEHEVVEKILSKRQGCLGKETFYHQNNEYDMLNITVPSDSYDFWCKTTETIEQSIQAAKAMIREKKNI